MRMLREAGLIALGSLAACSSPTVPGVGAPATLEVVSGANQSWLAGMILPDTIVVRVVDADGQPVPGVEIAVSVTGLGAVIDPTLATTTNEMGEAKVRWRLGIAVGPQTLRVELPSVAGVSGLDVQATATGADVIGVVGSSYPICATYRDGRVGCWLSDAPELTLPVPIMAPGALRFTGLASGTPSSGGNPMSLCAPATTGRVWCTDFNPTSRVFTPWRQVAGAYQRLGALTGSSARHPPSTGFSGQRYCGLDPDGVAWCWGTNTEGTLGDGTTISRDDARPVDGTMRFVQVNAAERHVCGLEGDGTAWCWGQNGRGQLGRPTAEGPQLVPVPVLTSLRFSSILATEEPGTCGIAHGGGLHCWGDRFQLGRPSPLPSGLGYSEVPLELPATGNVAMISHSHLATFVFGPSGQGVWWGLTGFTGWYLTPQPTVGPVPFSELVSNSDGNYICGRAGPGSGASCVRARALGPDEEFPPSNRFIRRFGMGVPAAP